MVALKISTVALKISVVALKISVLLFDDSFVHSYISDPSFGKMVALRLIP